MPTILHISKRHAGVVGLSRAENFDPSNVSPAMQTGFDAAQVVQNIEDIAYLTETDPEEEDNAAMFLWRYEPDPGSGVQFITGEGVALIKLSDIKDKNGNPATVE